MQKSSKEGLLALVPRNGTSALTRIIDYLRELFLILKDDRFFLKIISITFVVILYGALAIFFTDRYYSTKGAGGIFDAIYWAIVTLSTVGYGDIVPSSKASKVFALTIILSGPALLSLVTASVASIFVERKMKREEGLETISIRDHIILCGWNENGEKVLEGIIVQSKDTIPRVVLVNELNKEEMQSIKYKYEGHDLQFVRGNFVKEDVLARANLKRARAAIVLADVSGGHSLEKADERTIFGTMAIKTKAATVRTCAELINEDNREHLIRANVDAIIVRGESAGSLLAISAVSPGVADSVKMLVNNQDENKIWRIPVPSKFIEKPFSELHRYLREKYGALLLAVVKEEESVRLDDILSPDSTLIDEFIRRKFDESGKDFFGDKREVSVLINPPDTYEPQRNDWLVVISKERPSEAGLMERFVGGA